MPWNDEIAHWLLTTFRITGAWYVVANVSAWWKSASAVVPSPTTPEAMRVSPLIADAIAQPTAWMYCVPRLPEIEKKPTSRAEYMIGICRPCRRSFSLEKTWHIISTSGHRRAISHPCWRYVGKNMSSGCSSSA